MAKERAYINNTDRDIIAKYAVMHHANTRLILQKINSERKLNGIPSIKIKALIAEIRRGGGRDETAEGYNKRIAEKNYKFNNRKSIPFFDSRSQIVLCYLIIHLKLPVMRVLQEYKKLYKEKLVFSKVKGERELAFLKHQALLGRYDQNLWTRIVLESCDQTLPNIESLRNTDPIKFKLECLHRHLVKNPDLGKKVIFGDKPENYGKTEEEKFVEKFELQKQEEKSMNVPNNNGNAEVIDDTTTIVLPNNGKVKIINTSPKCEYQVIRKGNDVIIIL